METQDHLQILEKLSNDDLKKFQWCLKDRVFLKGLPLIPPYKLENADRMETVDLVMQCYSRQTLKVVVKILEKIPRNDLVDELNEQFCVSEGGPDVLRQYEDRKDGEMRPGLGPGPSFVSKKPHVQGSKHHHQSVEQHPETKIRGHPSGSEPEPEPDPDPRPKSASCKGHHVDEGGPQSADHSVPFVEPTECEDQWIHQQSPDPGEPSGLLNNMGDVLPPHLDSGNRVVSECQRRHKINLQQKFECVFEGIAKEGLPKTLLNQIYTELYITEGGATEVNQDHEVRQIETASEKPDRPPTTIRCNDIFKSTNDRHQPIRTVLTKGVAGIGKTILTQKFNLDWAEDKANQDIHFIFPLTFEHLNVLKQKKFSLVELVQHFFTETKEAGIWIFEDFQVVFILDGLDECRPPLDFNNTQILTDVTESSSVDVLLMNLIRGNLFPSARLWITTRPAAANQIPAQCVDMVTEVRGFTDPQKEEYFRKRFTDEEQTNTIISHIQRSQSVHIMCHIPVFCWITATVLEDMLKTTDRRQLPKTLTEMYIHFLVVQTKLKNIRYDGRSGTDSPWSPETRKMIESLGKLAFEQLKKGNLIFYESDLTECGIDINSASVYSGVFTEVFTEEIGPYQDKRFCFVHLSVQEFLAALHVHQTFTNTGVNLLSEKTSVWSKLLRVKPVQLYQTAVDQALQSPNGHLDLFLRFLLGLSLQTNQSLLHSLVKPTGSSSTTNQKTVEYIKKKISENVSAERSINLFHCLNELEDRSLVDQIQKYLRSGRLSTEQLSPAQWSALAFILLSSEKDLDVFDLKEYSASEEVLLRLLPVIKASRTALLSGCNLSERSCEALSSVLSSRSSCLRELDMSNNDLMDSGVKKLCSGLESRECKLENLRLSGCLITEEGCRSLALALMANPSYLRELDLSYNHLEESGKKYLSDAVNSPHWNLETLRLDHNGLQWLEPGLKKYFRELTLDENTANEKLKLRKGDRAVTCVKEKQPRPDHKDRFLKCPQLLCSTDLSGRCYWEVEWRGQVFTAVTYEGIGRKGRGDDCEFGGNEQSWSLICDDQYSVRHNNVETDLPQSSSSSDQVAVYVDCPAGSLSFYRVSSDKLIHLYTFNTTFTQPLFAGFWLYSGSSVSLCRPKKGKSSP
ncbi:NACHT, LRR and PYD domains-containing protein 12-like [Sphaeramia orbicularis]|nr:NACHT, LRR and PYD domains-containing protein 12-like [Sphaeramia orbicularis]